MKNTIKTILFMLCFTFLAGTALKGQTSDQILEKYNDTDGVMALNISGNFFNFIDDKADLDVDGAAEELLEKVGTIRMLIIEDGQAATAKKNIKKDVQQMLKGGDYKSLMQVKSDGDVIDFKFKPSKGKASGELVMLVDSEDSLVTLFIEGDFSADDAKKIARELRENDDINFGL